MAPDDDRPSDGNWVKDVVEIAKNRISERSLALSFIHDFIATTGRRGKVAFFYVLCGGIIEGVGFSLLMPLVSLFSRGSSEKRLPAMWIGHALERLSINTAENRLAVLLGLFTMVMVVRSVTLGARDAAMFDAQSSFVEVQRLRIVRNLIAARLDGTASLHHSRITGLVSSETQRLGFGIHFMLVGCAAFTMLLAQITFAFVISPPLAFTGLIMLGVGAVVLHPLLLRARAVGAEVMDANLTLSTTVAGFLSSVKEAQSQNLESRFLDETQRTLRGLAARQTDFVRRQIRSQRALGIISAIAAVGFIYVGVVWFRTSAPVLIALLLIMTRVIVPAGRIHSGAQHSMQVLAIYENLANINCDLFGAARHQTTAFQVADIPSGQIRFNDVCFQFDEGARSAANKSPPAILQHINISVAPGEFLGVTGPSGAGKTTLLDLLVGLRTPDIGCITVGGKELRGARLAAWRSTLSYLPQEAFLFHNTVRHNLAWSCPDADEAELWRALALADADDLVRAMDDGLDTVVGERGAFVSGGERQRIALARALLRRPRFLVLDEATCALDIDCERAIFARLRALRPRPTIVLVAHRAESLEMCDRVVHVYPSISVEGQGEPLKRVAAR